MTKLESIVAETIRLQADYSNALVHFSELTGSIVCITASRGDGTPSLIGFGFGSIGRYAHTEMIRDRFASRLLAADPTEYNNQHGEIDPVKMVHLMRRNEKPGGHGERTAAVGALDMAAWDLCAKFQKQPLYRVLAERFNDGVFDPSVSVYAAGGYYYDQDGLVRLCSELESYQKLGYESVKIKIGGASLEEDLNRVQLAVSVLGSADKVAVDANGRFNKSEALEWSRLLEPVGLCWFEEPVDPLDYDAMHAIADSYPHALATGENLFAVQDATNLIRFAGMRPECDVLQMDPGLSYGVAEYVKMLGILKAFGWSRRRCCPHGGNLFNLHIAQGLQIGGTEVYPGVFAPLGGLGEEVEIRNSLASAPDVPGIGWETKPDLMDVFNALETGVVRNS